MIDESFKDESIFIKSFQKLPFITVVLNISMLICLLLLSLAIDLYSIQISPFSELSDKIYPNLFWIYAFTEASIVENFQWMNLIISFIISLLLYFIIYFNNLTSTKKWVFLPIGLLVLYFEDKYNTRHVISEIIYDFSSFENMSLIEFQSCYYGTIIELFIYTIYGFIMLIALWKILAVEYFHKHKKYFIIGYLLYAIAAVISASRHLFNWYDIIGSKILNKIISGFDVTWSAEDILFQHNSLGFWFMDFVLEESLELLASSLILGGVIHLVYHYNQFKKL